MNARPPQLTGARGARDRGRTHAEQLAEFVCRPRWEDISVPLRGPAGVFAVDRAYRCQLRTPPRDTAQLAPPPDTEIHFPTPPTPCTRTTELAFPLLRAGHRHPKRRSRGVTEIRGPYYSVMEPRYVRDVLDTMGEHVDALKFAGGSFTLMPGPALREIIEIAHEHDVLVSTGGFIEHVLTQGPMP